MDRDSEETRSRDPEQTDAAQSSEGEHQEIGCGISRGVNGSESRHGAWKSTRRLE